MSTPTYTALESMTVRERTQAFFAWVKTKPAEETYLPASLDNCALAQFKMAVDAPHQLVYDHGFLTSRLTLSPSDYVPILSPSFGVVGWTGPYGSSLMADKDSRAKVTTFGALATYLEEHLAATVSQP